MATRKKSKKRRFQPKQLQYSKKLSTAVTTFWIIYRLAELVAAVVEPSISEALVKLVAGVDTVMMVNLGFYTGNSVSEKLLLTWMEKDTKKNEEEDHEDDENP